MRGHCSKKKRKRRERNHSDPEYMVASVLSAITKTKSKASNILSADLTSSTLPSSGSPSISPRSPSVSPRSSTLLNLCNTTDSQEKKRFSRSSSLRSFLSKSQEIKTRAIPTRSKSSYFLNPDRKEVKQLSLTCQENFEFYKVTLAVKPKYKLDKIGTKQTSVKEDEILLSLEDFAVKAGLDTTCDFDVFYNKVETHFQLSDDSRQTDRVLNVLELGAGYGRFLEPLVKTRGFQVTAIEQNANAVKTLKKRFSNHAKIIHTDFSQYNTKEKFHIICWMWCGLSDCPSEQEQLKMLTKFLSMLHFTGILVADTPGTRSNATNVSGNVHTIKNKKASYIGYVPTNAQIDKYVDTINISENASSFVIVEHTSYQTRTGNLRWMHFFTTVESSFSNIIDSGYSDATSNELAG